MRFYTTQHPFDCGIDLQARSMDVCILSHDGELWLHRHMHAAPAPFLQAVAPSREGLVVAVACIVTWYWLADLCAAQGIPFVLGHALSRKALHGGKAKNEKMDSQTIAALLRGGMLPHAYGYPAEMRATRDWLRRRPPLMRTRAELLAQVQNTNSQYTLPEIGTNIAYTANRAGVAERFEAPAVHKTLEVDLALLPSYDQRLSDLAPLYSHNGQTTRCPAPVPLTNSARHWQTPQSRPALRNAPDRSLPTGAGLRVVLPPHHVCPRIWGHTLRHVWKHDWERPPHMGLL